MLTGESVDLLWSDPETQVEAWALSPRGGGYLFGPLPTTAVSSSGEWREDTVKINVND